tara:strand:+ start:1534 stop:3240 length:1707 start_codon:yes stop_codon:yes gene_type:complete
MMRQNIANRPMFQTPQRKATGGIMAGVAPMYEGIGPMKLRGGGDPGVLSDFTLSLTQDDDKFNLRDITDFFFDPSDPLDYATLGLLAFPPAFAAARLAKMGVGAKKAAEQVSKMQAAKDAAIKQGIPLSTTFEVGRAAPEVIAMATEEGEEDPGLAQISAVVSQPEEEITVEGGIEALLPKSILEAREAKSPTFMRGGEEKAAVTKEELEASGIGSLREFLNQMEFDEETGEYVAKMNPGGLVPKGIAALFPFVDDILKSLSKTDPKAAKKLKESIDEIEVKGKSKDPEQQSFDLGDDPPEPPKTLASSTKRTDKTDKDKDDKKDDKKDDLDADETTTPTGNIFSRYPKTTTAGLVGAGLLGAGNLMVGEDGKPVETVSTVSDLKPKVTDGKDSSGGGDGGDTTFGSRITDYLSNALGKVKEFSSDIDPAVLAGLVNMGSSTDLFEPPKTDAQKFMEGMQGYKLQEAEIEKSKSDIERAFGSIVDIRERIGVPLNKEDEQKLLTSLFTAQEGGDQLLSIAKALGDNPDLKADPKIMAIFLNRINELLKSEGPGSTLTAIDKLKQQQSP